MAGARVEAGAVSLRRGSHACTSGSGVRRRGVDFLRPSFMRRAAPGSVLPARCRAGPMRRRCFRNSRMKRFGPGTGSASELRLIANPHDLLPYTSVSMPFTCSGRIGRVDRPVQQGPAWRMPGHSCPMSDRSKDQVLLHVLRLQPRPRCHRRRMFGEMTPQAWLCLVLPKVCVETRGP